MSLENEKVDCMGRLILLTGGCRSGKSDLAVQKARELSERVCFIATCVPEDNEMKARIAKHKSQRPGSWQVIEEPVHVADAISKIDSGKYPVVLVDCLTLWVYNLMCGKESAMSTEEQMAEEAERLVGATRHFGGDVIFVTNEVGMGIVPANEMARSYTGLVGRCNQVIAAGADTVIFVASGIPLILKQE